MRLIRPIHERVLPIRDLYIAAGEVQAHTVDEVLLTPLVHDYLAWTQPLDEKTTSLKRSAPENVAVKRQELWLSGGITDRAKDALESNDFRIYEYTLTFLERPWQGSVG